MRELKVSTAVNVMLFVTDSSDHVAGKTGLTLTIAASKDGGAFASITPTVTERGDGWYSLALTTSHTDTLGDLAIHVTSTGADPSDVVCRIVAIDKADAVRGGMTALPNAAAAAAGGLPILGTGAGALNPSGGKMPATLDALDVTGNLPANVVEWVGTVVTVNVAGVPRTDVSYVDGIAVQSTSDGTAQAGGASTITLEAATAPDDDDVLIDRTITITAGTGVGQSRVVTAYDGTTKVATVHRAWDVGPTSDSEYAIDPTAAVVVYDRTGYGLASTGLDSISASPEVGQPTTYRGWNMWLARRFGGEVTVPSDVGASGSQLIVKDVDGTTVLTTQDVTDDATTQTQGAVA